MQPSHYKSMVRHQFGCNCRLNKLASASGKAAPRKDVLKRLMNADFDPAEWDTHMAAAFGDDYYNAMEEEAEVRADDDEMARELASWPEGQEDTSGGAQQAGHGSGHPSANSDGTDASSSSDDGAEGGVASVKGQAGVSRGSDEDDSAQGQETIAAEKQRTKAEVCGCHL
jgi:KRI1-like family